MFFCFRQKTDLQKPLGAHEPTYGRSLDLPPKLRLHGQHDQKQALFRSILVQFHIPRKDRLLVVREVHVDSLVAVLHKLGYTSFIGKVSTKWVTVNQSLFQNTDDRHLVNFVIIAII
ncbi:hypothetical protein COV06_01570 [Candidatus Uhrbacteria bacterium CG10_big_fil_rev_8_21_14_0_10_50_16]|uniref:Uncharacterized protein n=1 Tax=Candidatus Uhrbacteria bacterium CG10_big_fil_rev_8_21_14_0_10_50_16 TaxID=1975039 RepID=A0A2H0RNH7_9BACT|nr:MAG: hypothetical protein COV06_01570 [Candidatus Uhrbacteria bacterium CG10_big_fil_rev_8_21_14_0_10_50_16]